MNIEARLKEIASVLNQDLIPQTFAANGWDDTEFPKFTFSDIDEEDLDEFSKLIQRLGSVGYLPKDQNIVNQIVDRAGFEGADKYKNMEQEEFDKLFPTATSRSGDGMETPFEGTAKTPTQDDSSTSNNENT